MNDLVRAELKKIIISAPYFMRKYCKIQHAQRGKILFDLYPFQEKTLGQLQKHKKNIILKSRQLGISTLLAAYCLWFCLLNKDKTVLVIATKQKVAANLVKKVKIMYDGLPVWLQKLGTLDIKNRLSLEFDNGSSITATSSSPDTGRSEAVSLLVVDECISGDTKIAIKNEYSGKEYSISISDLYDSATSVQEIYQDVELAAGFQYKILTPTGWSDFEYIKKIVVDKYVYIKTTTGKKLIGSLNHKIQTITGFKSLKDVQISDELIDGSIINKKEIIEDEIELFDIMGVELDNIYYTNDIISHNCAFIRGIDDIWASAQQTLATGGMACLISTPNGGGGNFFHKMWAHAISGDNGFNPIRLHWTVHPERDQKWRDAQDRELGVRMAAQECDAEFLTSGTTVVSPQALEFYNRQYKRDPIFKDERDRLWLWKWPEKNKRYIVSADVARGDGTDYSAFHILDMDTKEQVVEFKGLIDTRDYANLLIKWAFKYNTALLAVENASLGWDVVQTIYHAGYPNLYWSLQSQNKKNLLKDKTLMSEKKLVPGFTTSNATRPVMINRLEVLTDTKELIIHSERTLNELEAFKWINRKAQADKGYNDDIILSLAIGLFIIDSEYQNILRKSEYAAVSSKAFNTAGFGNTSSPTSQMLFDDGKTPINVNEWI